MRRTPTDPRRAGFTLVELLVVITILGILFALTAAAVVQFIGKGEEVQLRNEVTQLAAAVQAFQTQMGVWGIPDRIVLPPAADTTGATAQYFKSLWPRLDPAALSNATYWGGSGTLQGDQVLVFFLGGKFEGGACTGFSSSATNPMKSATPGETRIGPFYDFSPARLKVFAGAGRASLPSYVDVYGAAPYLFFSTGKAENYYQNAITVTVPTQGAVTVKPYQSNATRFANPSGFQIISAGKDQLFGTGGINWAVGGGADANGRDDVANFHPTALGIAQQ